MSEATTYSVKRIQRRQERVLNKNTTTKPATPPTPATPAATKQSKSFINNHVLHFICDLLKIVTLVTGFVGAYTIYINKQFWKSKKMRSYSINAITGYILVFVTSMARFIQIYKIDFKQFHFLRMAYEKRLRGMKERKQKNEGRTPKKVKVKLVPHQNHK